MKNPIAALPTPSTYTRLLLRRWPSWPRRAPATPEASAALAVALATLLGAPAPARAQEPAAPSAELLQELRQRLTRDLDDAEPTLAALDLLKHLQVDLVREHLLDAPEERVAVFLESVEKTAVHAETRRRVDDLFTLCRAFLTFKQFFRQTDQPPTAERPAIGAGPRAW